MALITHSNVHTKPPLVLVARLAAYNTLGHAGQGIENQNYLAVSNSMHLAISSRHRLCVISVNIGDSQL